MLTMILAAAMAGQVHEVDFYFMKATEDWIADNAPKPTGYASYIPKDLLEHVELWADDCARCRRNANRAVVAMGPDAIRWLFWPLRAKNLRVSMHAEAVIEALIRCRYCDGRGNCVEFTPMKSQPYNCVVCFRYSLSHQWENPECVHCGGAGVFAREGEEFSQR